MTLLSSTRNRSRLSGGSLLGAIGNILAKVAPHLLPALGELVKGPAEALGKKLGSLIHGNGMLLQAVGSGAKLPGGGFRLPGQQKKMLC